MSVEMKADMDEFDTLLHRCAHLVHHTQRGCSDYVSAHNVKGTTLPVAATINEINAALSEVMTLLHAVHSNVHKSRARLFSLFQSELEKQAQNAQGHVRQRDEEVVLLTKEAVSVRKLQLEWMMERSKAEQQKKLEIDILQRQVDHATEQLKQLSSNTYNLMEGEANAIQTGTGPLQRIILRPKSTYDGLTGEEFHFRLAESQFLRMCGKLASTYTVSCVEYIINPPLLKKYHDFKKQQAARGLTVFEKLTFHGTASSSIESIVQDGFQIGGVDVPIAIGQALGKGVYSSESPAFAMRYIRDGHSTLLFARVCPSEDTVVQYDATTGSIHQLVCKHRQQIIPIYLVHFEARKSVPSQYYPAPPPTSHVAINAGSGNISLAQHPFLAAFKGTRWKRFNALVESLPSQRGLQFLSVASHYQSITCMPEFSEKSFEELRIEDDEISKA